MSVRTILILAATVAIITGMAFVAPFFFMNIIFQESGGSVFTGEGMHSEKFNEEVNNFYASIEDLNREEGSQRETAAKRAIVKLALSAARSAAVIAELEDKDICKSASDHACKRGDLITSVKSAESICCHANNGKWVIWSALPDEGGSSSGTITSSVYCADSSGFSGEIDLAIETNLITTTNTAKCQ